MKKDCLQLPVVEMDYFTVEGKSNVGHGWYLIPTVKVKKLLGSRNLD